MSDFRADLHCHTTCSDGTYTPEQIVRHAVELGLKGLSITDHDCIEAYTTVLPLAQELGLEIVSGVEFSAVHQNVSIHILCYAFALDNPTIHKFCEKHKQRRGQRNREILDLLAHHGMPLTKEEIEIQSPHIPFNPRRAIGRPHIALAMVKKGYVENVNQAFKKFLGENKPCYSSGESFSVQETIQRIHEAKGFAVIAHPHLIDNPGIIHNLLQLDFDGIECYYAKFPSQKHKRWLKIAQDKHWMITGGSDFHGEIKPLISLGSSWIGEESFRPLYKRFRENEHTQDGWNGQDGQN
jgi:3',5'-nucleoside bisphosphate phosphatase